MYSMRRISVNVLMFLKVFFHRFSQNKLTQAAGYLTYNTLLALVPLLMVVFSIFTAFSVFSDITSDIKSFVFKNFVPSTSDVVEHYLNIFLANTKQISTISAISLVVVALMLIRSIDITLNHIWPHTKKRSFFYSFAVYWMILTLGPILIGVSIAVSSYVFSSDIFHHNSALPVEVKFLMFVPFLLSWLSFTLMYAIVPNTKVNILHALWGALVAAVLFTLGKQAFTWYMLNFHSYQLIYGALAILPLIILWIHLSWIFILLGAQLTAVLEDMRRIKEGELDLGMDLKSQYDKAHNQQAENQETDDGYIE